MPQSPAGGHAPLARAGGTDGAPRRRAPPRRWQRRRPERGVLRTRVCRRARFTAPPPNRVRRLAVGGPGGRGATGCRPPLHVTEISTLDRCDVFKIAIVLDGSWPRSTAASSHVIPARSGLERASGQTRSPHARVRLLPSPALIAPSASWTPRTRPDTAHPPRRIPIVPMERRHPPSPRLSSSTAAVCAGPPSAYEPAWTRTPAPPTPAVPRAASVMPRLGAWHPSTPTR